VLTTQYLPESGGDIDPAFLIEGMIRSPSKVIDRAYDDTLSHPFNPFHPLYTTLHHISLPYIEGKAKVSSKITLL
jgi:hypothetical protein